MRTVGGWTGAAATEECSGGECRVCRRCQVVPSQAHVADCTSVAPAQQGTNSSTMPVAGSKVMLDPTRAGGDVGVATSDQPRVAVQVQVWPAASGPLPSGTTRTAC